MNCELIKPCPGVYNLFYAKWYSRVLKILRTFTLTFFSPGGRRGKVEKRKRGEGGSQLGDRLQDKGSARAEILASPSNRQGVRAPGACQTRNCLHWAPVLQVTVRPCRTRARAFLGRSREKYVPQILLMLKPGLARVPARMHAIEQLAFGANPSTALT